MQNPSGSEAIIYTVPSGRYAIVSLLSYNGQGNLTVLYNFGGGQITGIVPETPTISSGGTILYTGDQLRRAVNTNYYYIFIKEYALP